MAEAWYIRAVVETRGNEARAHRLMKKLEKLLDTKKVDVGALIVGINQADSDVLRQMLLDEEEELLAEGIPEGVL